MGDARDAFTVRWPAVSTRLWSVVWARSKAVRPFPGIADLRFATLDGTGTVRYARFGAQGCGRGGALVSSRLGYVECRGGMIGIQHQADVARAAIPPTFS